jgi:putative copper resistance protein D
VTVARTTAATFLVAAAACVAALSLGGGAPQAVPEGLPDPGALVGWGLPLVSVVADALLVVLVGLLLAAAFLLPTASDDVQGLSVDAVRAAARSAGALSVVSLVLYVLTVADVFARPLDSLTPPLLTELATTSTGGVVLLQAVVGALAWAVLRWTLSVRTLAVVLGGVLASLVPVAFAGHSAQSGSHDLAALSLLLHLVGVCLWVGGLVALLWVAWRGSKRLRPALTRYSTLALWAFVVVGVSGVVNAGVRLRSVSDVVGTGYGQLVLAKVVALVALGWFGWAQRRRMVREDAGFARVAATEVLLMAATVGLAVALSRTPTPVGDVLTTPAQELLGGPLPPAPDALRLAWGFSANGLGLTVVALGAALYVRGVWSLRRRGDAWPVGRTISWCVGLLVVAYATLGGLGVYSHVLFSAHMVSHMLLSMVAPIFLVLGAPVTLALRTLPGPRQPGDVSPRTLLTSFLHARLMRVLTHPVVGPALFVGSLYALYFTPLFGFLMREHWGHTAMEVHFLLVGSLFYYVIIGVDPSPRRLPPLARFGVMLVTLPFHAFFSIAIMSSSRVLAESYWATLDRPYRTDLLADQYLGGSVSWALGEVPLVLVMIALLAQWFRSDQREARRIDRAADRDGDAELEAYNARLRDLAVHGKRRDPDAG